MHAHKATPRELTLEVRTRPETFIADRQVGLVIGPAAVKLKGAKAA